MTLALLSDCQKLINQLLDRNRTAWATTQATGPNKIAAYPFDEEIDAALLRSDGLVVTECYFQSKAPGLRNRFLTTSGNLADGAKLPEFQGLIGKAEWSTDNVTFIASEEQDTKSAITEANQQGTYISAAAFQGMHHFSGDGYVFHTSPYFKFEYPAYTRTAALQSLQQHEPLIITWALELLYKERAPESAGVEFYRKSRGELCERVIAGEMRLSAPLQLPLDRKE